MSRIATSELLQIRELLQMETNAAAKAKAMQAMIKDDELQTLVKSGIQTSEARIKNLQKFISDNNIASMEVH